MHDLPAIAAELVAGLRAQLPAQGFRLDGVEVQVGVLLELDLAALTAALQQLLPSVEIKIQVEPAILHCEDCGADYPADEHPCPVCGSGRASVLHGQELGITRAWGETVPTSIV